jgi:hypothetical protein
MTGEIDTSLLASSNSTKTIIWWLFIIVIGGLLPFVIVWMTRLGAGKPHALYDVLDGGEMLVTCFVLSSAGIGELLSEQPPIGMTETLAVAASVVVITISYAWFASIQTGGKFPRGMVTKGSFILLSSAAVASYTCSRAAL